MMRILAPTSASRIKVLRPRATRIETSRSVCSVHGGIEWFRVARIADAVAIGVRLLGTIHRARRIEDVGTVVGRIGDAVTIAIAC
jgi:hypothetical protein